MQNRLRFHDVANHCIGGSSRLIVALLFGDVGDGPLPKPAMCAPVSERYVSCFVIFSFLLCRFVSGPCPHTPVWRRQLFFAVNSVSSSSFNSIQCRFLNLFQFSLFCSFTSTQCRKRFDHSVSLPAEKMNLFHRSKFTCPSVVHVQLDHRSVSNISNVRILFIQHDNVSSSNDFFALK